MDGFTEEATFGLSKNMARSLHVGSRSILGRGPSKEWRPECVSSVQEAARRSRG